MVPDAPWRRVIQTGHYAIVLDTDRLAIPHFGALPDGVSYSDCGKGEKWKSLPPAELDLGIDVNGKSYRCVGGGAWGRHAGPRLIEAGRFFQRSDVTDLIFESAEGERLNVEARFETVAWAERLGLVLAAKPGRRLIEAGEGSFGRSGGGFGLDGSNSFDVPHAPEIDTEEFTLEFWVFVPVDYRVSERVWPWLVCKNRNEAADGNYGIMIVDGRAEARLNIGGGRDGQVAVGSKKVRLGQWNHLVMSYDGESFRLFLNGVLSGEQRVSKRRQPGRHPLVFGRREDNHGDGYRFRGVIDQVRYFDRALRPGELGRPPRRAWDFRATGVSSNTLLPERWENPVLKVALTSAGKGLRRQGEGEAVTLSIDPVAMAAIGDANPVVVHAGDRPVSYEPALGCLRINLDGIEPLRSGTNDAMERVRFAVKNLSDEHQVARLMFEKTARGIRQRIGSPITGLSAILRDSEGNPTGIPVQLSKNWHHHPEAGAYSGQWFHGMTQLRLPPRGEVELELVIVYGHWGGVAAASHAQLSLVGWGANQRWDESALGSWGESICYEPDQIQGKCTITDVRPLMVTPMSGSGQWSWTNNVGGGDFFLMFAKDGQRVAHSSMRASYHKHGPCLTEVTYSGRLGRGIVHSETVSLGRSDDIVRGIYRLRMDVREETEFSRFVLFQVGADTYNPTREAKLAIGNEQGVIKEWESQAGGDIYRTAPLECAGQIPWWSLHEGRPIREGEKKGAWANRGIVIRSWKARLGGKEAAPWVAERGSRNTSTLDLLPPPGTARLLPGDYVEAVIEYLVVPQSAADYYGPNQQLRAALAEHGNTWTMIQREAVRNHRRVEMGEGNLVRVHPDVRVVCAENGSAGFTLTGGIGYVPVTFTGLGAASGFQLSVDGVVVDQGVHGNDFWQTDYDPDKMSWSQTFNVPITGAKPHTIRLEPKP